MRLKTTVTGSKKIIQGYKMFGQAGEDMVKKVTSLTANEIEAEAKRLAPVDKGDLQQNIIAQALNPLAWRITSFMRYSAYMEFGTGGLVRVPPELKEIAIQYKGAGIKKIDLKPQPFMHPAFLKGRIIYDRDLKQGLKILTNKFNKK